MSHLHIKITTETISIKCDIHVVSIVCFIDKCKNLADLTVFEARSNCRGYYECLGGKAVPKCCPLGYRYEVANGCVEDKEKVCDDRCFNEKAKKRGNYLFFII